jgi:hypothetical protein
MIDIVVIFIRCQTWSTLTSSPPVGILFAQDPLLGCCFLWNFLKITPVLGFGSLILTSIPSSDFPFPHGLPKVQCK